MLRFGMVWIMESDKNAVAGINDGARATKNY